MKGRRCHQRPNEEAAEFEPPFVIKTWWKARAKQWQPDSIETANAEIVSRSLE
jgi:hypothetical protein